MRRKLFAILVGLSTHILFLFGVGWMAVSLHGGMTIGKGGFRGNAAVAANALLLLQFPLLHSFFLASRGRRLLVRWIPFDLGRDLSTTAYAAFASLQVLVVFAVWSPSGRVLWRPEGGLFVAWTVVYAASWLVLGKAMLDAGLGLQTGYAGWWAVARGRHPVYGTFPEHGLFRLCRQPVYLAFALVTWTAPTWTPDRLALGVVWTLYCVTGPLLKERRYLGFYGGAFRRYQARVPYLWPSFAARRVHRSGA